MKHRFMAMNIRDYVFTALNKKDLKNIFTLQSYIFKIFLLFIIDFINIVVELFFCTMNISVALKEIENIFVYYIVFYLYVLLQHNDSCSFFI
ncbi:hypothetical protein GCM10023261_12060 [Bartonella jaculi]|uniref:Uncharacterized protein n=1 Tax=Bartonella jaculi TaxID=686226 RepID=A0ABP9N4T0_9HYPH